MSAAPANATVKYSTTLTTGGLASYAVTSLRVRDLMVLGMSNLDIVSVVHQQWLGGSRSTGDRRGVPHHTINSERVDLNWVLAHSLFLFMAFQCFSMAGLGHAVRFHMFWESLFVRSRLILIIFVVVLEFPIPIFTD